MKRILKRHLRHRVIVTLKSGSAFGGVLYDQDPEALEIREASVLEANGTDRMHIPADGAVVVLRADVDYIQIP